MENRTNIKECLSADVPLLTAKLESSGNKDSTEFFGIWENSLAAERVEEAWLTGSFDILERARGGCNDVTRWVSSPQGREKEGKHWGRRLWKVRVLLSCLVAGNGLPSLLARAIGALVAVGHP